MSQVPWRLRDLPWGDWIALTPVVQIDEKRDDYHRRAWAWLADKPGQDAPLSDEEHDQLVNWISVPIDRLQLSSIGVVGGFFGPKIVAASGLTLLVPATAFVGFGIGCIGLGYAVVSVKVGLHKRRRAALIDEIDGVLGTIAETRVRPPQLPAPGPPDTTMDQINTDAAKVPR